MMHHTGEKPYGCLAEGCARAYARLEHLKIHIAVHHTRCQSDACEIYPLSYRKPGTYKYEDKRYCFFCLAVICPERVTAQVRREHHIVAELKRLVAEMDEFASIAVWDCPVPGGCSLKRPDLLFVFDEFYVQIEVDEYGHPDNSCWDEDARLEIIAADVGKPGVVLRINPDEAPLLKKRKGRDGEIVWDATEHFDPCMQRAADFLRSILKGPPKEGLRRFFLASNDNPRETR